MRRKLPPLTRMQIARLPLPLQQAHEAWVEGPGTALAADQLRERARGLALSLLELGEDAEATERQLHTWRLHPAIAHEAVAWAVERHRVTARVVARRPASRGRLTARGSIRPRARRRPDA